MDKNDLEKIEDLLEDLTGVDIEIEIAKPKPKKRKVVTPPAKPLTSKEKQKLAIELYYKRKREDREKKLAAKRK